MENDKKIEKNETLENFMVRILNQWVQISGVVIDDSVHESEGVADVHITSDQYMKLDSESKYALKCVLTLMINMLYPYKDYLKEHMLYAYKCLEEFEKLYEFMYEFENFVDRMAKKSDQEEDCLREEKKD